MGACVRDGVIANAGAWAEWPEGGRPGKDMGGEGRAGPKVLVEAGGEQPYDLDMT